jgi:hypothetical protein
VNGWEIPFVSTLTPGLTSIRAPETASQRNFVRLELTLGMHVLFLQIVMGATAARQVAFRFYASSHELLR